MSRYKLFRHSSEAEKKQGDSHGPEVPHVSAYLAKLSKRVVAQTSEESRSPESEAVEALPVESQPVPVLQVSTAPVAAPQVNNQPASEDVKTPRALISLRIWGYYFVAKLLLFGLELIGFHPLENLVFAVFVLWPVDSKVWRRVKALFTALLALSLLYYDSWLPPITRVIEKSASLANFSPAYLLELISRFVSWSVIAWLLLVWFVYWIVSKRLNLGLLLVAGIALLWLAQSPLADFAVQKFRNESPAAVVANMRPDMKNELKSFFDKEETRSVFLPVPDAKQVPFDLIFIHICSLSWDDLQAVEMDQHPLWKKFDILLTRFNSAASYSGPAAIHLLRATCGQQEHEKMYASAPEGCYLMSNLRHSGYVPDLAMNHNGQFDDFLGQVQKYGKLDIPPMSQDGLDIALQSFYGTPVYDDFSLLSRWLEKRNMSPDKRVALYYDTVTMHDGNAVPGNGSSRNALETYKTRLTGFLSNMEKFMQSLEKSGRRAVVVMISDHGRSLRGDKMQIAGLREIPTPAIALVPVGIRVIGGDVRRVGKPVSNSQPTSYLALAHILSAMLEKSPYNGKQFNSADYVMGLPSTRFVAQSEIATVIEYQNHYYLRRGADDWQDYVEFNVPTVRY